MYPDDVELIVDEPIKGHFYWMLLKHERIDVQPHPIEYAAGPMPSHASAMMAGIAALQRRIDGGRAASPPPTGARSSFV